MNRRWKEEKEKESGERGEKRKDQDDIFVLTHSEDVCFFRSLYFVIFHLKCVHKSVLSKGNPVLNIKYKHMSNGITYRERNVKSKKTTFKSVQKTRIWAHF